MMIDMETIMFVLNYLKAWWNVQINKKKEEIPPNGVVGDAAVPQIVVMADAETTDGSLTGTVKFPDGAFFQCLLSKTHKPKLDGSYSVEPNLDGSYSVQPIRFSGAKEGFRFVFHKGKPQPFEIVVGSSYGENNGRSVMYGGHKLKEKFMERCDQLAGTPVVIVVNLKKGE